MLKITNGGLAQDAL